jgi:thiol-disulfide isomerase/thioredoxin
MKAYLWTALVLVSVAWGQTQAAWAAPAVGSVAPAFVGQDLGGHPLDLAALKGHVVIVNLWATWCTPCRAEMPMLETFYNQHKGDGVVLVGLSADRPRDLGEVRRVMTPFTYPAAVLADAKVNGFGRPGALPQTYVIDATGKVRVVFDNSAGPLTKDQLTAAVEGLTKP